MFSDLNYNKIVELHYYYILLCIKEYIKMHKNAQISLKKIKNLLGRGFSDPNPCGKWDTCSPYLSLFGASAFAGRHPRQEIPKRLFRPCMYRSVQCWHQTVFDNDVSLRENYYELLPY